MAQTRQKSDANWFALLRTFIKREYFSVLLSASLGAVCAGLMRLLLSDHLFDTFLTSKYLPTGHTFDNPTRYVPYF